MFKKRFLGFLLSACILASSMPVYTFANEAEITEEQLIQEVVSGVDVNDTTTTDEVTLEENLTDTTNAPELDFVANVNQKTGSDAEPTEQDAISYHRYLSSFENSEMPVQKVGWGSYTRDKNLDNGKITLVVDGQKKQFLRGVVAHAAAELQYDLGENHHYDYFSGYLGIDANRTKGSVTFDIYVSDNGSDWTHVHNTGVKRHNSNASFVKISVKGHRYLRFVIGVSDNGNEADHSTLADAKVYSENYVDKSQEFIKPVSYYNEILAGKTYDEILADESLELTLLQRELAKRVDIATINNLLSYYCDENGVNKVDKSAEFFNWLFNDLENMRLYIGGGMPESGEYVSSITILNNLYQKYKADLSDTQPLYAPQAQNANQTRGDLYKRMMITLSLTHTVQIRSWISGTNYNPPSNPINRYQIFKDLYEDKLLENRIFENLQIEEMRWVMKSHVNDDEIKWLNYWVRKTSNSGYQTSSYTYVRYAANYNNYNNAPYYSEENREKWDKKYNLSQFGVEYNGDRTHPRLWIVFEEGAVCGGISKTYQNISSVFGVPANVVHQPGHAACTQYAQNSDGTSYWWIFNDISSWPQSRIEISSDRMLLAWGNCNSRGVSGYQLSYINMIQAALDNYDNYLKAEEIVCLADLATTTEDKIKCYQKALEYLPYHFDAWYELIQVYLNDSTKTSKDFGDLAEQLSNSMKFFPMPMCDLMNFISNKLNSIYNSNKTDENASQVARFKMLKDTALRRASVATYSDLPQYACTKTMANNLLGNSRYTLATFSFDGTNANKLMFDKTYQSVTFKYCLNYNSEPENRVWKQVTVSSSEMSYQFSDGEIAQINANDDIKILLVGLNDVESNYFTIDILAPSAVSGIYRNDNENRILGNTTNMEYSIDHIPVDLANGVEGKEGTWQPLTNDIVFKGNVRVYVRKKAFGTTLATTAPHSYFTFTNNEDSMPKTRSYISITREKLFAYSTQETSRANDYAAYAIDGILSTRWHTNWSANSDLQRYIVVQFDKPTYFSGINYTPSTEGINGRFTACEVYVSLDSKTWYLAGSASGWAQDTSEKKITFAEPVYGQYVKVVATGVAGSGNHANAANIEFYEDLTIADKVISGAKITDKPTKLTYQQYEELNLTGMVVRCFYTDGTATNVPLSMLNVNTKVLDKLGKNTISVNYLNLPAMKFDVDVVENTRTATSFDIQTNPTKTNYYAGDKLNLSGMVLKATDSSGNWYPADNYTVSISDIDFDYKNDALTEGTHTVTIKYQNLQDTFTITVDKAISSISVTTPPTTTQYFVGATFDSTGMVVTLNYQDGTTKTLTDTDYVISNLNSFSGFSGTKNIGIYLLGRSDICTTQEVTVLPNFEYGDFKFELVVDDTNQTTSDDTNKTYLVKVSNYSNTTETNVVVPNTFKLGEYTYKVVGIEENAFATTTQIESLTLYGNEFTLYNGSLTNLSNLNKIYLINATSMDNIVIEKGALSCCIDGKIYTANTQLANTLNEKLSVVSTDNGDNSTPIKENYNVVSITDEIKNITIDKLTKTTYKLDENLDTSTFVVNATLNDDTTIILPNTLYSVDTDKLTVLGDKKVTVSVNNTDIVATFDIVVESATMYIATQPKDASYIKVSQQTVEPLSVEVATTGGTITYQWYYSTDTNYDPETDEAIAGATSSVYELDTSKSGYYYVVVSCVDANGTAGSTLKSLGVYVLMGDFNVIIESRQTGSCSLAETINMAKNGDVITLTSDITVNSTANVGSKNITINANGYKITRANDFKNALITVSGGTLTIVNTTLDGGAIWETNENSAIKRSTTNKGVTANDSFIKLSGSSKLILKDNTVIQNVCGTTMGATIYVSDSSVVVGDNITIKDCQTSADYGAVIFVQSAGQVTLNGGTFSGNYAKRATVVCTNSYTAKTVTINGGMYCYNQAAENGAVVFIGGNSYATISNATFENNTAKNGSVLYMHNIGSVAFNGNTCNNNIATERGGIIYNTSGTINIDNVKANNSTAQYGGFIYSNSTNATKIQNTTIDKAKATNSGGCIYNNNSGAFTLNNITVTNGSAVNGGYIYNNASGAITITNGEYDTLNATQKAGFIYNANSGTININGSTISNCTATDKGGCIYSGGSGAINFNNDVTIQNCSSQSYGGVVCIENSSANVTVNSGNFLNNYSALGGGVFTNISGGGTVYIKGGYFSGNTSPNYGGVLYTNSHNTYATITGGTYENNSSVNGMGGVLFFGGTTNHNISNATFNNNTAVYGGVICSYNNSTVTINDCTFNGNTATQNGAVFYDNLFKNTTIADSKLLNIASQCTITVPSTEGSNVKERMVDGDNSTLWINNGGNWPCTFSLQLPDTNAKDVVKVKVKFENHNNRSMDVSLKYAVDNDTNNLIEVTGSNKTATLSTGYEFTFSTPQAMSNLYITLNNPLTDGKTGLFWPAVAEIELYVDNRTEQDKIIVNNTTLNINSGTFTNNQANGNGAIAFLNCSTVNINGGTFKNNTATLGNSIYGDGTVNISNFEEIDEIYLPADRFITISGDMSNKYLPVNMQTNIIDTKVATCTSTDYINSAINSINVTNCNYTLSNDDNNIVIADAIRIDLSDATVSDGIVYYDGTEKTFEPVVMYNGKNLVANIDYTISGATTGKDAGEYDITLTGIGNFTGSKTIKFSVIDKLKFKGASLTIQNNIAVNYFVNESYFKTNGYTNPYVVFNMNDREVTVSEFTIQNGYYVFTFSDIGPHLICDNITSTLYADYKGETYCSDTNTYSVGKYCENKLNDTTISDELRELIVDLLNYGSMAQIAVNHNKDKLANAKLTDAQKQEFVTWSNNKQYTSVRNLTTDMATSEFDWKAASLNLNDSIDINAFFTIADTNGVSVVVKDEKGNVVQTITDFVDAGNNEMKITFNKINAAQLSDKYTFTAYKNNQQISNVLTYSVESYAFAKKNSTNKALVNLVNSMMKYGETAKAYVKSVK